METTTVMVDGALSENVRDSKDTLARQTRVLVKEQVVAVGGILKKFDVYSGVIFVDVDTSDAANAVVKLFSTITGAVAKVVEPLQAIYRKAQLKPAEKIEQMAA
jgi:hypothetical protein